MPNVDSSNIYSNNKSTINKNGKPQKKSLKIFRPETLKRAHNDAFMAASIGDLEWLKQTLCILPEIFHDKNGFSPIHVASIHGRLNIIKYLIEDKSIDPNFPSNHGWRPIHLCISTQTGDRAMNCLEYLARMGADINATNEDNVTPLHVAATEGHFECLKALIKLDADTEKKDIRGHTALDLAKIWGHRACGKLLTSILWQEDQKEIAIDNKLKRKNHAQEVLKEIERTYLAHYDDKKESEEKFNEWLKTQGFQPHKTEKSTINTHKNKDNNEVPEMHKEKKVDLNKRKKTNSQKKTLDSKDWNQSTKVLNKSYTTNLDDFYPRDPFTNLPENIDLVLVNRELRGMSLENVKEFMSANISNSSSKLVTSNSRPVYFRPKYVKDLPKKSVNEEKKEERIDSAGVNLTNDPRSFPFKQMSHYINKRGLNKSLHSDSKSDENLNIITRNYGNDLSEYMMDKRHGKLSKKYEKVFIC